MKELTTLYQTTLFRKEDVKQAQELLDKHRYDAAERFSLEAILILSKMFNQGNIV